MATTDTMTTAFGRIMQNSNRGIGLGRQNQTRDERPKSQYWLNIGYTVEYPLEDGATEPRFVSLPTGIPLDGQEHLATNSKNEAFAAFQSARNSLLDQLMAIAQTLQPGEDKTIKLEVQLRRVNSELESIKNEDNPFVKVLTLV